MDTKSTVRASDGWTLGIRVVAATAPVRGVALLLHAMMVDGRTFFMSGEGGLAGVLAAAGWEVWAADFRGHKLSGPVPTAGGSWTYDDLVRRDVPALVAAARQRHATVVIVGHSLGGHVSAASLGAEHTRVDALVLLAANIWRPSLEPSRRLRLAKATAIRVFAGGAALLGRYPSKRLGHGPDDESAAYCADLARFWIRDAWTSRDGMEDWTSGLTTITCPVLQLHATGDALLGAEEGARNWAAPIPKLESWRVGGGACGVSEAPSHIGLLTATSCRPVHEAVATWLGARRIV